MVVNQFKLVNNSNNKGIKFHFAEGFNDNITISNVSVQNASSTSGTNYSRNWGGFKRIINVSFVLYNDGTDKSTDGSNKITLTQQHDHLMETIVQGTGSGDSVPDITYTATIWMDGAAKTYTGSLEDINISGRKDSANQLSGSFNIFEAGG